MTEKKNNGDEKPDVSPDSGAPEVEVEVVVDKEPEAAAFDDIPDDDRDAASPTPRKPALTPGVLLFIVFAVVALLLFFTWRMQQRGTPPLEASDLAQSSPPVEAVQAPVTDQDLPQSTPSPSERLAADEPYPDPEPQDTTVARSEEKIVPATDEPAGDDAYLPPVGGTAPLEEKSDDVQAVSEAVIESEPDQSQSFKPETESQTLASGAPSEDAPASEGSGAALNDRADTNSSDQMTLENSVNPDLAAKITNDIDTLKQTLQAQSESLKTERERAETLAEEIQMMRQNFSEALAARDARSDAALSALRQDLDKIRNEDGVASGRVAMGAAALPALRRAAEAGSPFAQELDIVAGFAPKAPPLRVLEKHAEAGVPAVMALKQGFGPAARQALAAAGLESANGFFGRLSARAKSVVSVRPAEPQSGETARAIISRAENAVLEEDFTAALAELNTLPENARTAMDGWTGKARARAEIDAALDALDAYFLQASAG